MSDQNNSPVPTPVPLPEEVLVPGTEQRSVPTETDPEAKVFDGIIPPEPEYDVDLTADPVKPAEDVKEPAQVKEPRENAYNHYPISDGPFDPNLDSVNLPSALDVEVNAALTAMPNVAVADSFSTRRWAHILEDSLAFNTAGEVLVKSFSQPGREFRNHHEHNGRDLNSRRPSSRPMEGQQLQGERAVIRVINKLNQGTIYQVELWHSGLHIMFKPPVETEIVDLHHSIMADNIEFGRKSYGLVHSNYTAFVVDKLVKFAIDHIYETTANPEKGVSVNNIRDHIMAQDLPVLLWGLACSMYPRGFNYRRSCVTNPEVCNHIVEEKLNISKLIYTSMKTLTEWQKNFMSARQPNQKTLEELKRYREEMSSIQGRRVTIHKDTPEEISFVLRSPTLTEYIQSGHAWISGIVNNVERSLADEVSNEVREANMVTHGNATMMRQYAHWVESIEERDGPDTQPNVITDKESIEKTLSVLSANDEIREFFMDEVTKYIDFSQISLIGIPVHDCPACGQLQKGVKNYPEHQEVIPLDPIQVFFDLISQKLARIQNR